VKQKAILALDQGTTGTTCLVLDARARVIGRAYSEFDQHYPQPGWVEHDAAQIWAVTQRVMREAIAGVPDYDIVGLGITNQRETVVVWDRATGEPVHRAIVWQDRRTTALCRDLKNAGKEAWVRQKTGLVLDPYFSGTKLQWLLEHVPGLRERADTGELAAGTIDAWLVYKLTDGRVHATDHTNASRTLLYDINRLAWDDELLSLFTVPRVLLPEVRPSSGDFGETTVESIGIRVPIAGIAGDQQAALFGQRCCGAGQGKNTYGTGAFLLLNTGNERVESKHGLLATIACGPRGEPSYALEGSIFIAGAAIQWLRDEMRIIERANETEQIARSLASNDGVYLVPAFVGLGAPHWEPDARGAIYGLTRGSGRAQVVRAALEAMAFATADVLRAMEEDASIRAVELAVDGGAAQNDWLMQFQADILGIPVNRSANVETTAQGAGGLAGIATGIWTDVNDFYESRDPGTTFTPSMGETQRAELIRGWQRAVRATLAWAHDRVSA